MRTAAAAVIGLVLVAQRLPPAALAIGRTAMRRDLVLMYAAQALRYLAPLILVPFYGRTLGISAYGQLLSGMALMQIAWVMVEWGLPSTGLRDVASASNADERGRLIGEQVCARLTLAGLVAPACVGVAWLVPALHDNLAMSLLCASVGIANAFNMTWYFQGLMRFRLAASIEVCGLIASTSLILLLVTGPDGAWFIPGVLLLVSIFSLLSQLALAFNSARLHATTLRRSLAAIRTSTLLFIDRGQAMLLGPLSVLLLGAVASPAQVAWFALAERLLGVLAAMLNPLNQVFAGMMSNSVASLRSGAAVEHTHRLMRKVISHSVVLTVLIAGTAFALAGHLLPIVLGPGFAEVVPVFRVLCAALLALNIGGALTGTALYPLRHDRDVAFISTVRLCATLLCVALSGAVLDGLGGAWGRLLGACVTLVAVLMALHRHAMLPSLLSRR